MQAPISFSCQPSVIMRRLNIQINILIIILLLVCIVYNGYIRYSVYKQEIQREIYRVADLMHNCLESSGILLHKRFGNESETKQVMMLNRELQPIVNEVAKTYKNIGMGFYSIELDHIVAIHPFEPQKLTRISHDDYPYFKIYETGQEMYGQNDTSFGWNSKSILYYARPIRENGVIVGHVWANAKMEDIYQRVYVPTMNIIVFWLIALTLCYLYAKKITKNTKHALENFSATAVTEGIGNENPFPELDPLIASYKTKSEELEKLNNKLSNTLERISDGFYSLDNDWKFTYVNEEAKRLLSLQGKNILNKVFWEELKSPATAIIYEKYKQAVETKKPVNFEAFSYIANKWLAMTVYPSENGISVYFKDISEQKKAEELFYKAFQLSPDIMAIENISTAKFVDVNDSFIKCFGYSKDEILGKSVTELRIVDQETAEKIDRQFKEDGFIRNIELEAFSKQRERHYILMSCEEVVINGKKCRLNCAKDISEKVQIEKEMKRLDRLNTLGEMASGIAHEIRNPLTVVRGFLQLMIERQNDSSKILGLMIEELDRANSIISEYLSFAKNKPVELQAQNLNHLIRKLCPLIQADAVKSDKDIFLDLQDIPLILIDEKEIRQLILNLARNGLESMPPGRTLYLRTYRVGGGVMFEVKDEGCGIPQNVLDKIGQPFVTTKDDGTGLGLSVCYSICERHNARMDYTTGPEGTTFYVKFSA